MPLKFFIHPETGKYLDVNECLEQGLLNDYYPLSYLKACALERKWSGKPSTTQLIAGTRQAFLKIFFPYAINPNDQIFRIIGTRSHEKLEKLTPKKSFAELTIDETEITGTADLLEQQPNGDWWLVDYKTTGAFAIKRALGIVKHKRPMKNIQGEHVRYVRNTKNNKVGDIKQEDFWVTDETKIDFGTWALQLNKYRKEIEIYFDIKIAKMKIFAIPRETDKLVTVRYGIERRPYYIDVPEMTYEEIDNYFESKRELLLNHVYELNKDDQTCILLENDIMDSRVKLYIPPPCSYEEAWEGRKCEGYCEVAGACKHFGCPYLEG